MISVKHQKKIHSAGYHIRASSNDQVDSGSSHFLKMGSQATVLRQPMRHTLGLAIK
jgi:hypothetical protein